jgi:hypothetical protein
MDGDLVSFGDVEIVRVRSHVAANITISENAVYNRSISISSRTSVQWMHCTVTLTYTYTYT